MPKRTYVKATGLFAGLRVPQSARGKYVLVDHGKVIATAATPKTLMRVAVKRDVRPLILHVPEDGSLVAAY